MKQTKHRTATLVRDYLVIFVIGVVLLYPIIWMFFASFKSNDEIFGSICLLPQNFSFKYFIEGWKGSGKVTYTSFLLIHFYWSFPLPYLRLCPVPWLLMALQDFSFRERRSFLYCLLPC